MLLAGLLIVVAPHALRAPWWLTLLTLALYAWRAAALSDRSLLPPRWVLLAVAALAGGGVWLEYRAIFGRTPGIMLLVLFSGLKLLESRNQRDAAAVVFLTWFLAITNFLSTQSIPTAIGMCAAVATSVAALVGFAAPRREWRANLRTARLLLAQAVPAALVLFLLFPRVQGPLWGLPQDAYAGMSGLSDTMTPGSLSQLTLSDAIAFRVEFQGAAPPPQRALLARAGDVRLRRPHLAPGIGRLRRTAAAAGRHPLRLRGAARAAQPPLAVRARDARRACRSARATWTTAASWPCSRCARACATRWPRSSTPSPARPSAGRYLRRALRLPPGFNPRAARAGRELARRLGGQRQHRGARDRVLPRASACSTPPSRRCSGAIRSTSSCSSRGRGSASTFPPRSCS